MKKNSFLNSYFFIFLLLYNIVYSQSWVELTKPNLTSVNAIITDESGKLFVGGEMSGFRYGGVFLSSNDGIVWTEINNGLYNSPVLSLNTFSSAQVWAGTENGLYLSTNNGALWSYKFSPHTDRVRSFIKAKNGRYFASGDHGVLYSTNSGEQWSYKFLSAGYMTDAMIYCLLEDNNGYLYAGASNYSSVFRSTDNGLTWNSSNNGIGSTWVRTLVQTTQGDILAGCLNFGVYRSTDQTASWSTSNSGLTNTSINRLLIVPDGRVIAGTFGGIFQSTDNGKTWSSMNSGLTDLVVNALHINKNGYIYAGTMSGRIFKSTFAVTGVENEIIPNEFFLHQNYPNPFNPTTIIKYSIPKASFVQLKVYDLLGKEVRELINEFQSAGSYKIKFDSNNISSGIYFYRITSGNNSITRKMIILR